MTQNALIATSRFHDLAGSEITALEIATHLAASGWSVTIAAFEIGSSLREAAGLANVTLVNLGANEEISASWDLIWTFHAMAYYAVFIDRSLTGKKVIFSSLSHFEPIECPPIETHPIDAFTVNSKEHLQFFKAEYPEYADRVMCLPNSAPDLYFQFASSHDKPSPPRRICVVSNHPPRELLDAMQLLNTQGIDVDLIGIDGTPRLIRPEILLDYDCIVTIGKTTQYCLAVGIPVFCYDQFGGPGWIRRSNIDRAAAYNFSGRCSKKKLSSQKLIEKILSNNCPDPIDIAHLRDYAKSHFLLSKNVMSVLNYTDSAQSKFATPLSLTARNILARTNKIALRSRLTEIALRNAYDTVSERHKISQHNANEQITYRDSLITELNELVKNERENFHNINSYNEKIIAELKSKADLAEHLLTELDSHAREAIHQVGELLSSHQNTTEQRILERINTISDGFLESNSTTVSHFKEIEDTVNSLASYINAVNENYNAQILYRNDIILKNENDFNDVVNEANAKLEYRNSLISNLSELLKQEKETSIAANALNEQIILNLKENTALSDRILTTIDTCAHDAVSKIEGLLSFHHIETKKEVFENINAVGNDLLEISEATFSHIDQLGKSVHTLGSYINDVNNNYDAQIMHRDLMINRLNNEVQHERSIINSSVSEIGKVLSSCLEATETNISAHLMALNENSLSSYDTVISKASSIESLLYSLTSHLGQTNENYDAQLTQKNTAIEKLENDLVSLKADLHSKVLQKDSIISSLETTLDKLTQESKNAISEKSLAMDKLKEHFINSDKQHRDINEGLLNEISILRDQIKTKDLKIKAATDILESRKLLFYRIFNKQPHS